MIEMKKVLSFVLVLSLVLSSFSMAFAGEVKTTGLSDIAGVANEEAINVVNDLGIVTGYEDGTFKADKAVKRAEFAVMITKALGIPESALAGYTATSFNDVAGYEWAVPYLAFCESKGIMSGYGEGIVKPGNTITVNEAMTMVLRAVGYTPNSSELVGSWPSNYVTLAQDLELYDDVAAVATVDRGSAAQIIYNSLTVWKVQVDADGATDFATAGGNMLTSGLNCHEEDPDVITDADIDRSLINLGKYMGAYATVYANKDGEIVAVGEVESTFLTGEYDATDDEFTTVDEVTYKVQDCLNASNAAVLIKNGSDMGTPVTDIDTIVEDVTITLAVELKGKTIVDIYSVKAWDIDGTVSKAVSAQMDEGDVEDIVGDQAILGVEFYLTDEDEIDYDMFDLVGVKSLKDIKEDHVVYVYTYETGLYKDYVSRIVVGTNVVEGTITDYDGDDAVWTIAGKDYALATNPSAAAVALLDGLAPASVGDTFKLFLDGYGDIYAAEEIEATPDTYAVLTYYQTAGIEDAKVKLYTSEDKTKTFAVTDDVADDLDGASITNGAVINVLIGYSLDKDGVIDSVDLTAANAAAGSTVATKTFTVGGTSHVFADTVTVFTFDGVDEYGLSKIGELESTLTAAATYILSDNEVVAMLVSDVDAGASADDTFAVFNKSIYTYDATQEDTVDKVTGFFDGVAATKNANNEDVVTAAAVQTGLYKVEFDADGYIKVVTAVTDGSDYKVVGDFTSATAIDELSKSKTVVSLTGSALAYELADDVVVYEYDADAEEYVLSRVSALRVGYSVLLYNTDYDGGDDEEIDVVIFQK